MVRVSEPPEREIFHVNTEIDLFLLLVVSVVLEEAAARVGSVLPLELGIVNRCPSVLVQTMQEASSQ